MAPMSSRMSTIRRIVPRLMLLAPDRLEPGFGSAR
jgi:hypothetical protein